MAEPRPRSTGRGRSRCGRAPRARRSRSPASWSRRCASSGWSRTAGGPRNPCKGCYFELVLADGRNLVVFREPRSRQACAGSSSGRSTVYVELHAHSVVLVPRRRLAARGARDPRRRVRLRGLRAHRPRQRLRGDGVRAGLRRARGAADRRRRADRHRRRGASFHLTLLVESATGWHNLCRLLTEAHAGTRPNARSRPPPPRRWRSTRCSSAARGSSASPAAPATGRSPAPGSAASRAGPRRWRGGCRRLRARALPGRAAAAAVAARPGAQPLAGRARRAARRRLRGDRQRPRPRPPRGPSSRTRWSRCACTRRSRSPSPSGAATRARCSPRRRRWRRALPSIRTRSPRPRGWPSGCASTSPRELGYRYPGSEDPDADRTLAEICRGRLELRYAGTARAPRGRRGGSRRSCG